MRQSRRPEARLLSNPYPMVGCPLLKETVDRTGSKKTRTTASSLHCKRLVETVFSHILLVFPVSPLPARLFGGAPSSEVHSRRSPQLMAIVGRPRCAGYCWIPGTVYVEAIDASGYKESPLLKSSSWCSVEGLRSHVSRAALLALHQQIEEIQC